MIRITSKQLREMNACERGINWFNGQSARTLKRLVPALLRSDRPNYALWLLPRLMTHPQKLNFAVYAAEHVLGLFEKVYPNDDRPRKAVQAAKDFVAGKISANIAYAADAANAAAYAAAYAAANAAANAAYAAYAAAYAAYAAAYAADAAAYAAANAAYAAANAAAYAAANAAYAAANAAAYAAANAAANAAYAAANAAAYAAANAAADAAANAAIYKKITDYGLEILGEGGKPNGK